MSLTWILATLFGLLFNLMYVSRYFGISVLLMTLLSVAMIYHYRKRADLPIDKKFIVISSYMLALSPVFAVTTVTVVRFWAGFILTILWLSLTICELEFRWPKWLLASFEMTFGSIGKMFSYFQHGGNLASEKHKQVKQVLIGVLIALPLLFVAGALLISADVIMGQMASDLFENLELDGFGKWLWRLFVFLTVTPMVYGLSLYMARQKTKEVLIKEDLKVAVIPPTISGTVLVLLNLLYLLFAYIQIKYLFFEAPTPLLENYDYATYARRGFFELVTLSVLNTIGILTINKFTLPHLLNKIGLTITVACTYIMIASSIFKMYLYESTYGYTQLRLYVYLILAYMVVFMCFITLSIWKPKFRVIEVAMVIGLLYFLVVSYVNVDLIIVENNIARYGGTGDIDKYYLFELSEDAVPRVLAFIEDNAIEYDDEYRYDPYKSTVRRIMREDQKRWFFEYNYRHRKAVKAIEALGLE